MMENQETGAEVLNKSTGELVVKGESFVTKTGLFNLNVVRASPLGALDYRFNAKGQNKMNEKELFLVQGGVLFNKKGDLIDNITIQIIAYNLIDCKDKILFNQQHSKTLLWCEILFLDSRNVVSSIFIKGHSLDNLKNYAKKLQLLGDTPKSPNEVLTKVTALKMTSDNYGLYYVLDFEEVGEPTKEVLEDLETIFDPKNPLGMEVLRTAPRYPSSVQIIERS